MKKNDVILEIRPGVGGDEAELWARQLLEMYERIANRLGWRWQTIAVKKSDLGGVKEAVVEISGLQFPQMTNVEIRMSNQAQNPNDKKFGIRNSELISYWPYELLKHEAGVHRVQRIPKTEKHGRIHTSTATVAVLPVVSEQDVKISPNDLQTDFYRAGGHGGQNVNKVETAVRIRHLPSGLVVTSQQERSQAANRDRAMDVLRAKLHALQQSTANNQQSTIRSEQVGTGDRSEKIRTYNFHQDRVTDHRIHQSWGGVERILDGDIINVIGAINLTNKSTNKSTK